MARRVLHDRYFRQAKAEGYLARSAYKLIEIDDRFGVLSRGMRVADLGCAPGSWLQVAAERVGDRGRVVGVDLKPAANRLPEGVVAVEGDIESIDPAALLGPAGGRFHAVVSDMAPNTSGHGDDLVSARLCRSVLALLPAIIEPGGHLVMKILEGQEYPLVLRETAALFGRAKGFKPKASREVSREMFIVAKGYRGPTGGAGTDDRPHRPGPVEGWR